ncbi:MAG: glycosyltransferase [Bacteroidota bacterium]
MPADSQKKIVCVHLLNDYSGSPLILSMVIKGLVQSGYQVDLITSSEGNGFLSDLPVKYKFLNYRFHENKYIRLFRFFKAQVVLFFMVMQYAFSNVTIYINTLLPFGGALAGKLSGKKVIYHIHESYIQPKMLKSFLRKIAAWCADSAVYVSNYLLNAEQLPGVKNTVIYNALPDEFTTRATAGFHSAVKNQFTVLMVSSLKEYKGVRYFVELAAKIPQLKFEMVLNANQKEIDRFFEDMHLTSNLKLFTAQKDVHPFYERASLVVNLSIPDQCKETFGMTLLEGMCYGLPVIAPPAGGPAEVVRNGINGFCIDVRNSDEMQQSILEIHNNESLRKKLSHGALATAELFEESTLQCNVKRVVDAVRA